MTPDHTVPLDRTTARALALFIGHADRPQIGKYAALRVKGTTARWEATDGHAMVLIGVKIDLPPGLYVADAAAIRRCAGIPEKYRTSADDVVEVREAGKDDWPDTTYVLDDANTRAEASPEKAARALGWVQMERLAKLARMYQVTTARGYNHRIASPLDPTVWDLMDRPVQVVVMPMRTDPPIPVAGVVRGEP